jgi:hypothetical protein
MQIKRKKLNLTLVRSRNNSKRIIELIFMQLKNKIISYFVIPFFLRILV